VKGIKRWVVLALVGLVIFAGCREQVAPLPVLGQVEQFALTDQDGKATSLGSFAGKPWVAAFMFTRCPSICPRITQAMKGLQAQANEKKLQVHWVSFSVDPSNDTPIVLREYMQTQGVDAANWSFLTGDIAVIRNTAEQSFKQALEGQADPQKPDFGITHGSHLVLVDPKGAIRGFYRSSDETELQKLLTDLATLQAE
jgi:protein SCO1/2